MITSHVLLSPLELKKFSQTKAWGKLVTADSVTFLLVVPLLGVFFLFPLFFFVYTQRNARTNRPLRLVSLFSLFTILVRFVLDRGRQVNSWVRSGLLYVRTYVCVRVSAVT